MTKRTAVDADSCIRHAAH